MTDARKQERLHVLSYVKVEENSESPVARKLMDISSAGMRLRGNVSLEPGCQCRFVMHLPTKEGTYRKVVFEADVIWSKPAEQPGDWDCGIKLLDLSRADMDAIEGFIEGTSYQDRWLAISTSFYDEVD